mgnify:CR=1 FL=1
MAKDVCEILALENPRSSLALLDEDEKGYFRISEGTSPQGGNPNLLIISESGLYALVFRSHKPEARAFSKWVRGDVLPAYRQKGFVGTPPQSRVGPLPRPRPCLKCSFNPASARKAT